MKYIIAELKKGRLMRTDKRVYEASYDEAVKRLSEQENIPDCDELLRKYQIIRGGQPRAIGMWV